MSILGAASAAAAASGGSASVANWTPEDDPELIAFAFFQEDLSDGAVTTWQSRGVSPKTATGTATKLTSSGGVLFAKNTTERVSWANDSNTPRLNRWWLVIAKCDIANKFNNNIAPALAVHTTSGNNTSKHPAIWYNPGTTTLNQGLNDGANKTLTATAGDFTGWDVLFGTQRGWSFLGTINGTDQTPLEFLSMRQNIANSLSWIGAGATSPGNQVLGADLVVDCVIVGQGEPSDDFIDKLIGWAHWRAGREDLLPIDHPYKSAAPLADGAEGAPSRFVFDPAVYATYEATTVDRSHLGDAPPTPDPTYSRVFFHDFLTDPIEDMNTGSPTAPFYDRTWLWTEINKDADCNRKADTPACYIHTATAPGYTSLRLQNDGARLVSGAFSTVNEAGKGRWWRKGRFLTRIRFTGIDPFGGPGDYPWTGFFPAWWCYGKDHLYWLTRNRLEFDYFEHEGDSIEDDRIAQAMHVHTGHISHSTGSPEEIAQTSEHAAGMAGAPNIDTANGWPSDLHTYADWHVYEWRIEDDFVYTILDGLEVARRPVWPGMFEPKYFIWDFAWFTGVGADPTGLGPWDMDIDYFEVWVKEADLAVVPTGFSARPTLAGTRGSGNTITCTPNTTASQIEYRWYKDGEPIVGEEGATFVEDADSETKALRVHVRAVSLLDQPEAWSAQMSPSLVPGTSALVITGFAPTVVTVALVLIDRTAGTNIGDMTNSGGLAAAFDGTANDISSNCATKVSSASGYVGKTLASAKIFGRAIVHGSNNQGFRLVAGDVTLTIYGKTGSAPSSATDGTAVGTATFTDELDESAGRQIESTDTVTAWDHLWVHVLPTASDALRVAELVLYELA